MSTASYGEDHLGHSYRVSTLWGSLLFLAAFEVLFPSTAHTQDVLVDITKYAGQPIRNYPEKALVTANPHFRIVWNARPNCNEFEKLSKETVVDQGRAFEVQKYVLSQLGSRIHRFNEFASKAVPKWNELIVKRLFPIEVHLELEMSFACAGSHVFNGKPELSIGTSFESREFDALDSILMHEVAHIIFRLMGYPQSLLIHEEALADSIALFANDFNPLIGKGLGKRLLEETKKMLGEPTLSPIQRALLEQRLAVLTENALRDLTLELKYASLYEFPEPHSGAAYLGALLYRVGNIIGSDTLMELVLEALFDGNHAFRSPDYWLTAQSLLDNFKRKNPSRYQQEYPHIEEIFSRLEWKATFKKEDVLPVSLLKETFPNGARWQLDYAVPPSLSEQMYPARAKVVGFTVTGNGKNVIGVYSILDLMKTNIFITKTENCDPQYNPCLCGDDIRSLELSALFLAKDKRVTVAKSEKIDTSSLSQSGNCYRFQRGMN